LFFLNSFNITATRLQPLRFVRIKSQAAAISTGRSNVIGTVSPSEGV
jgi:hypothetical protein